MAKFLSLNNNILKTVLKEYELSTSGNKAEMVKRLEEETKSDVIDPMVLANILPKDNSEVHAQMDSLEVLMEQVMGKVAQLNNRYLSTESAIETDNEQRTNVLTEPTKRLATDESVPRPANSSHETTPTISSPAVPFNERLVQNESGPNVIGITIQPVITPSEGPHSLTSGNEFQRNNGSGRMPGHSVRDIVAVLPEFDPIHGNLSYKQFLDKIDSLSKTYEWHENAVLYAFDLK